VSEAVIVSAVRTPIGAFMGALSPVPATELNEAFAALCIGGGQGIAMVVERVPRG
jgi:acetyl-CoA acetyltransferase